MLARWSGALGWRSSGLEWWVWPHGGLAREGWCLKGCWNGEGGGAVAGGAWAGGTGRVAGWGESDKERENVKVREREKVESERERQTGNSKK